MVAVLSMHEIFGAADEKYGGIVEAIVEYIDCGERNYTFREIFASADKLSGTCSAEKRKRLSKLRKGRPGVYLFVASRDFTMNSLALKDYASLKGANINRSNISRLEVRKGEVFYTGSAQDIGKRITEHYSTYAGNSSLHLDSAKRRIVAQNLTAYIFSLRDEFYAFSRDLLRAIEGRLHDKYKPVAGIFR